MVFRKIITVISLFLFPVVIFSAPQQFNADSVYSYIEHLSVKIGPRPMGSENERIALNWAESKFMSFGADTTFILKYTTASSSTNTNSGVTVAIFKGKTDSTIVIGGHIDSAGREYPGANDNASGSASVIELARIWSQRERHYTMLFACFGGEERGLIGSKHFADEYPEIDSVVLMLCLDMTGSDDEVEVMFETNKAQAPKWLVKDAYAIDKAIDFNRLKYPTHFSTINNIGDQGAGSDHESFLNKGIPAIDFTAGISNSPIHSPQDELKLISKPMLAQCGQLADSMITHYQNGGIPKTKNSQFYLWEVMGILLFIPSWFIITINFLALFLGIGAFIYSRKHRMRIEKSDRVRFSGLKVLSMLVIVLIFAQFGENILGLIKGVRYARMVHIYEYLWYAVIWGIAGLWVGLQLTRKWKFNPDAYIYAKRVIIVLLILMIPSAFLRMRLMFYPAIAMLLASIAIFIRRPVLKAVFAFIAPLPLIRLFFSEPYKFISRGLIQAGVNLDSFMENMIFAVILIASMVALFLPAFNLFAYTIVSFQPLKSLLKYFRKPIFAYLILAVIFIYGIFLYSLPAYNDEWRPNIHVKAEYEMPKGESKLELVSNEYFHDVNVVSDSVNRTYDERIYKDELDIPFKAEWLNLESNYAIRKGEKDTIDFDWRIISLKPWYKSVFTIQIDSLEIDSVHSDLNFKHEKNEVTFIWSADPEESLRVHATLIAPTDSKFIQKVEGIYPEMPVLLEVTSDLANVRYRTTVTLRDTLNVSQNSGNDE